MVGVLLLQLSVLLCFGMGKVSPQIMADTTRLHKDLWSGYEQLQLVPPLHNASHPMEVKLGVTLQHVTEIGQVVNGPEGPMVDVRLLIWYNLQWRDFRLRWSATEYSDLRTLRAPVSKLWVPDIQLYNHLTEASRYLFTDKDTAVVYSDGSITLVPSYDVHVRCPVSGEIISCKLKYGSWTYDGFKLNLVFSNDKVDLGTYDGLYEITDTAGERNEVFYDCCPEPYIDVTFDIHIRVPGGVSSCQKLSMTFLNALVFAAVSFFAIVIKY